MGYSIPKSNDSWLSIDPGKHVGVACWLGDSLVWSREFWHTDFYAWLHEHFEQAGFHTVVCESFYLFQGKAQQKVGSDFPEVKVIGVVEYLCKINGVRYKPQHPSVKQNGKTCAKLRGLRYPRGSSDHVKDAIIHGAFFLGPPSA